MDDAVAQTAIKWWVTLQSGEGGADASEACQRWRDADPRHEYAWSRLERLALATRDIPSGFAHAHLIGTRTARAGASPNRQRRGVLKGVAAALLVGGTGVTVAEWTPWQRLLADYSTRVGERRRVILPDNVQLDLASDTAVSVALIHGKRQVTLWRGQMGIAMESAENVVPLLVKADGNRLETRYATFALWQRPSGLRVDVYKGALGVDAQDVGFRVLTAGTAFYRKDDRWHEGPALQSRAAWIDGLLVANGDKLGAVVAQLARYHRGVLRVSPEVASLPVSGVFPLDEPDRAIDMLQYAMPIKITRWGTWWCQIDALDEPQRVSSRTQT